MNAPSNTAKSAYQTVMRAYRLAHKTDIMSENGFVMRMQATTHVRNYTGQWDIPVMSHTSPWERRKTAYKPTLAFRRHLKGN